MNTPNSCTSRASAQTVTKAKLAKILDVTPRTIQNYVACGALPPPETLGRSAVWSVESLRRVAAGERGEGTLPTAARAVMREYLESPCSAKPSASPAATSAEPNISTGFLVDDEANVDLDLRPRIYELNAENREAARAFHHDALGQQRGSDEGRRLFDLAQRNRDAVERNEDRLKREFIPAHGSGQLLGAREMCNHPMFTVCNSQLPRETNRDETFKLPDGKTMRYTGPELRQGDALVFAAMIRVASDVRPGRLVGFSPEELCRTLFNDYSGYRRRQLGTIIRRLQCAKLTFDDFAVHLVGRFDFPKKGLWTVALDRDVVRLFADGRQVWLKLDKVLDYGKGIAGWAYRYICAQTTLIPKKVDHLRRSSGSVGSLAGFREDLREALDKLVAGGDIEPGWFIDKHDMVRWKKTARPRAEISDQVTKLASTA